MAHFLQARLEPLLNGVVQVVDARSGGTKRSGGPNAVARRGRSRKQSRKRGVPQSLIELGMLANARVGPLPRHVEPQRASASESAPEGDEWVHEILLDGYRLMVRAKDAQVRLLNEHGEDWTAHLPDLVEALSRLSFGEALIDGQVVVLQADGTSSFKQLHDGLARSRTADVVYEAFDLLHLDGYDLTRVDLGTRKQLLKSLLASRGVAPNRGPVRYVHHFVGKGAELLDEVRELGLDGLVSKRRMSRYESGLTGEWRTMKCAHRGSFVVGGYTEPTRARDGFGVLLLGYRMADGRLSYVGGVGTGFGVSAGSVRELYAALRKLETERCPFSEGLERARSGGVHWVRPELVVDVDFSEWTREGLLRYPVLRRLGPDREPSAMVLAVQQIRARGANGKARGGASIARRRSRSSVGHSRRSGRGGRASD